MPYSSDSLEGRAQMVRNAWAQKSALAPDGPWVCEVFDTYAVVEKDGKYYRVPYTVEGTAVSFGDAEEVKVEYETVTEALEALAPRGKKWEVRAIREGKSAHGWIYTQKALESLVPLLNGMKLRAVRTVTGVFGHNGTLVGEIGALSNARGVDIGGFYEPRADAEIAEERREWLLKAMESGEVGGVSINVMCDVVRLRDGDTWVKKFIGPGSLDLATVPSAGGAFLRATESLEGDVMNREKILELLKKKRPDLYAKLAADCTIEQAQEALEEALGTGTAPARNAQEGGQSLTAQEAQELRALVEQGKKDSSAAYLTLKLSESKLPDPVKKKIEKQFSGQLFAREALDTAITAEKEMLDQLAKSGQVAGAGETRVEIGQEAGDKIQVALDKTFGVKVEGHDGIKPWRGIREAYVQITGDSEITGRLPAHRMRAQEAIVAADFPKLLDRTMNRRVVQDYQEQDYGERRIISFIGSATDFKTQEANRVGYFNDLSTVDPETADYQEAVKPGEESVTYKVTTRGNILTITRVTIMNDDLSGILRRVRGWGRAARRTFARFVWNFWINNSTYDGDATAWFTAGHGNLQSVALAAAEMVSAITKLMNMTEPGSAEKLGLNLLQGGVQALGLHLVVPTALWDTAKKENGREYLDANFTPNAAYQAFGASGERIIVLPLLTDANDWGIFSNPQDRDILEVKFLNGQEEPEIFIADQPTVGQMFVADKIQYKIRHEYGGDILDFRGAVKAQVA